MWTKYISIILDTQHDIQSSLTSLEGTKHVLINALGCIINEHRLFPFKERELEVSKASLAVANAASILSSKDSKNTGGLRHSQVSVSSLEEEVLSLRAENSSLRKEITSQVLPDMFFFKNIH